MFKVFLFVGFIFFALFGSSLFLSLWIDGGIFIEFGQECQVDCTSELEICKKCQIKWIELNLNKSYDCVKIPSHFSYNQTLRCKLINNEIVQVITNRDLELKQIVVICGSICLWLAFVLMISYTVLSVRERTNRNYSFLTYEASLWEKN